MKKTVREVIELLEANGWTYIGTRGVRLLLPANAIAIWQKERSSLFYERQN